MISLAEDITEKVARLETKVEEHSKSIEKMNENNDVLVEMKTILRMQTEINSETKEQIKEFGVTLNKVNENLTNLNINQQQMKTDMSEIGSRVTDIEKNQEKHKIDVFGLVKNILGYVVTAIVGGVVLWIYMKLGIKN